jgi:hypothetical protein
MLEYVALVLLLLSITAIFYIFIYIHDIPHAIAKRRHHPQEEVIHYACWLSLFTLHAIWPIVFLWAIAKPRPLSVSIEGGSAGATDAAAGRIAQLEERLRKLEEAAAQSKTGGTV